MSLTSRGASLPRIGRTFGLRENMSTVGDFVSLMKPRVMSLVVFTAFVGLCLAPGQIDRAVRDVTVRDGLDFTSEHGLQQRAIIDTLGTSGRLSWN